MQAVLSVQDLKKTYDGKTQILKGLTFDIYPGEFVVLIGSSGSGKSTLLRCINGFTEISGGDVLFKGQSVKKANKRQIRDIRKNIGMIFQNYNLIDRSTVIQNVLNGQLGRMNDIQGVFGMFSQADRKKALNLLDRVDMAEHFMKRGDELSGGQKQRVAICRAMAQEPDLLLADEPIASLDPASSIAVMDHLQRICLEDGITGLVSLHQVEFARQYATRIIAIQHGEIRYDGPPHGLTEALVKAVYDREPENLSSRDQATVLLKDVLTQDLMTGQALDPSPEEKDEVGLK